MKLDKGQRNKDEDQSNNVNCRVLQRGATDDGAASRTFAKAQKWSLLDRLPELEFGNGLSWNWFRLKYHRSCPV